MGGKNGLEAVEKTLIDLAVISVYRNYLADPKPENMPILGDLYDEIKKQLLTRQVSAKPMIRLRVWA